MAESLLKYHLNDQTIIDRVAEKLNKGYFTHTFPIQRNEAKKLGLPSIKNSDDAIEKLMWQMFSQYESLLLLNDPYSAETEYSKATDDKTPLVTELDRAIIETRIEGGLNSLIFKTRRRILQTQFNHPNLGTVPQLLESDISNKWELNQAK